MGAVSGDSSQERVYVSSGKLKADQRKQILIVTE